MKTERRKVIKVRKRVSGKNYTQYVITLPKEFGRQAGNEVRLIVTDFFIILYPSRYDEDTIKRLVITSLR